MKPLEPVGHLEYGRIKTFMEDENKDIQNRNAENFEQEMLRPETVAEFAVRGCGSHTFCCGCADDVTVCRNKHYLLQVDRTEEVGLALFPSRPCPNHSIKIDPSVSAIRPLTDEEEELLVQRRVEEVKAMKLIKDKVKEHQLNMKVSNVEFNHDESIIFCYFTAPERVDFRELVRDLGHTFRKRIELKQIGARDETRMIGGHGHCGNQLCCSGVFRAAILPSVSMKMAKTQKLSTNPQNLLGLCGKLRCCLAYEYKEYHENGQPDISNRPIKEASVPQYHDSSETTEPNPEEAQ